MVKDKSKEPVLTTFTCNGDYVAILSTNGTAKVNTPSPYLFLMFDCGFLELFIPGYRFTSLFMENRKDFLDWDLRHELALCLCLSACWGLWTWDSFLRMADFKVSPLAQLREFFKCNLFFATIVNSYFSIIWISF